MQNKPHVDAIDRQIIALLKQDSRMSYRHIAEQIGKTEATVRRRVNTLKQEKVIERFTIVLNEKKLDNPTKATIKIQPEIQNIKNIILELKKIDEITDIWRLSGDCGIMVRVELPSLEKLDPLIEDKISQINGINIKETCFITRIAKSKY